MHILIFTSLYPTRQGDHTGVFVQQQVRALAQVHKVTVIAPELVRPSQVLGRTSLIEQEKSWTVLRPRYLYIPGLWWLFYMIASLRCARHISWSSVDIVHAHVAIPAGFTAAWLSRLHRKPFVLTEHSGRFADLISTFARRATVKWTLRQALRIIVVSQALQERIERAGINGSFSVIPNIVDPDVFHPKQDSTRPKPGRLHLLWVGSFHPAHYRNKGIIELLHALKIAHSELGDGIRLTLIGEGAALAECQALAEGLSVSGACDFAGLLPHTQVRDWMQRCEALILASHNESFGVVLVEAMACGKPVIATRCGGPEEIVTPETGILVEPGNPQALADGIVDLMENYDTFVPSRISKYAHAEFNPQRVAQMITCVYNDLGVAEHQQGTELRRD